MSPFKKITQTQFNNMAAKHELWLKEKKGGKRAYFTNCVLESISLEDLVFSDAIFENAKLEKCSFKNCNFERAFFVDATIENVVFDNSSINRANFKHAKLINTSFKETYLQFTNFDSSFSFECDFTKAYLMHADFSYATLDKCKLIDTELYYVIMRHTEFNESKIINSILNAANLSYAKINNTEIENASVREVISKNIQGIDVYTTQFNTSRRNNVLSYWPSLGVWTTGCFQGTLEELRARIDVKYDKNPNLRKMYHESIDHILRMELLNAGAQNILQKEALPF